MSNRWFRFVIALLAIGAAGAAGYRILQHEQQLARAAASARAGEYAAESAITTTSEIKAALHAYVAAGQGHDFWTARAGMLIEKLRASFVELDRATAGHEVVTTDELDLSDRLAVAEKRARNHLGAGQLLLAGEVIFTDARDALDAMRIGLVGVRDAIAEAADRRTAAIRREQAMLLLGAAGVMVMAVLVLVPPARATATSVPAAAPVASTAPERRITPVAGAAVAPGRRTPSASPHESSGARDGETSSKRPGGREGGPAASASARESSDASYGETSPKRLGGREGGPVLMEAAAVCTDLGRVSQGNELSALLGRAGKVLSASGVIVWVASENRDELFPAASSGYDERLFERIGSIRRDASNLTAAAFRGGGPRTSAGGGGSPAALAVPLLTPQGPVGVFSAELREVPEVDSNRLALAAIFAAQLANLLGSISTNAETVGEAQAQNG